MCMFFKEFPAEKKKEEKPKVEVKQNDNSNQPKNIDDKTVAIQSEVNNSERRLFTHV